MKKNTKKIIKTAGFILLPIAVSIPAYYLYKNKHKFFKMKTNPKKLSMSNKGINLIKEFEGFRADAYRDSGGVLTIGYGHTFGVEQGDKIDKNRAEELLRMDVTNAESAVRRLVKVPVNQNQFDALVSFTYNLGEGNLKNSSLLKALNNKEYEKAAKLFELYNKAGGRKLAGLVKRRNQEQKLFTA